MIYCLDQVKIVFYSSEKDWKLVRGVLGKFFVFFDGGLVVYVDGFGFVLVVELVRVEIVVGIRLFYVVERQVGVNQGMVVDLYCFCLQMVGVVQGLGQIVGLDVGGQIKIVVVGQVQCFFVIGYLYQVYYWVKNFFMVEMQFGVGVYYQCWWNIVFFCIWFGVVVDEFCFLLVSFFEVGCYFVVVGLGDYWVDLCCFLYFRFYLQ